MKKENIVYDKSKAFAIRIVNLRNYLADEKKRIRAFKADAQKRNKHRREYC